MIARTRASFGFAAVWLCLVLAAGIPGAAAAQEIPREVQLAFAGGVGGATIEDSLTGFASVSYGFAAEAGQRLTVWLDGGEEGQLAFTLFGPGEGPGSAGLAVSYLRDDRIAGPNLFDAALASTGRYTVNVYQLSISIETGPRIGVQKGPPCLVC